MSVSFAAKARCSRGPAPSTVIHVKPSPSALGRHISSKKTEGLPQELFSKCASYLSFSDLVALERVSKFYKQKFLDISVLNPFLQKMQFFVGITKQLGGVAPLPVNGGEFSGRELHPNSWGDLQASYVEQLPKVKIVQRAFQQAPHKKYENQITAFTDVKKEMVQMLVGRLKNQEFGLKTREEAIFYILKQLCYLIASCKNDCLTFEFNPGFLKTIETHFGDIIMAPPVAPPSKGCCVIC